MNMRREDREAYEVMDDYEKINDGLVHLINEGWEMEGRVLITEEFRDISNNDIHIIDAIGPGKGSNMTNIAHKMNVTVSTLTTAMNNLVRKGYADRYRSERDRRLVLIRLTDKGLRAYAHHADYHEKMSQAIEDMLTTEEAGVLIRALEKLDDFMEAMAENSQAEKN